MLQKRKLNPKFLLALLALLILGSSIDTFAQRRKPTLHRRTVTRRTVPAPALYAVPAGTTLRVRINETVNSKTARIGDSVTGTVVDPIYSSNGVLVIPQGSTVAGRVDAVTPAAKGGKPGSLD